MKSNDKYFSVPASGSLPTRGAWIEIGGTYGGGGGGGGRSPHGERGLKFPYVLQLKQAACVAPHTGSVD
ncbi:hypothetical protein BACCAP_00020 [Pseudoflavonifractor capillosus ATCC 29799]|uniref:Uncharacterized protein n=1 Tax=Pseudoflavonifractor capillosus ATCC 29799 TaxID=411467 RepID=A6NP88_9FIRM|nr:hypothetical protein BACCAP_00020 [Pseudoflavonifractor capillosus ATCC 29799]